MNIHLLQHVPYEGPGSIESWAINHGHSLSVTRLYAGDPLPGLERFDLLVVLGGPMSVHDQYTHVWLKAEQWFIQQVLEAGKPILGICLGAQLIARVLGSEVAPARQGEYGWYPVTLAPEFAASDFGQRLPAQFDAFHWHGETFTLPDGASRIGSSEQCPEQGFIYNDRVIALQCHLETTQLAAESLIRNNPEALHAPGAEQSEAAILDDPLRFIEANRIMAVILEHLAEQAAAMPHM
ncbi:MAG: type 1 glutamine amidotransferase [Pseudomonadota bacterium]